MYADTAVILQRHNIAPIVGWEAAVSMLQKWAVFLSVMIVTPIEHRALYELTLLIEAMEGVSTHLQSQEHYQPYMPVALF